MSGSPNRCPITEFDPEDIREYFEERAGILEFDHGMTRPEAEQEARRRTLARYGEQAALILSKFDGGEP